MNNSVTSLDENLLKIYRTRPAAKFRGKSISSHYNDILVGLCTPPVRLGMRASGYPLYELYILNAVQIAGKLPDEIKGIVKFLEMRRGTIIQPSDLQNLMAELAEKWNLPCSQGGELV